jgi:hypothetical protein
MVDVRVSRSRGLSELMTRADPPKQVVQNLDFRTWKVNRFSCQASDELNFAQLVQPPILTAMPPGELQAVANHHLSCPGDTT